MFAAAAAGVRSFGDLAWKTPARVGTVGALPANTYSNGVKTANANGALPSIDGIALSVGDRLVLRNEATASNNGIYTVTSLGSAGSKWVLTRSTDCDTASEMVAGTAVLIRQGTTWGMHLFIASTAWTPTSGDPAWFTSPYIDADHIYTSILLAQLETIATARILGNVSGGAAAPSALTAAQVAGALGIQVPIQAATLVLASIAAGGNHSDSITWPVAFADNNYTVALTVFQGGFTAHNATVALTAKTATGITFRTVNEDTAARTPTIHAIAVHD